MNEPTAVWNDQGMARCSSCGAQLAKRRGDLRGPGGDAIVTHIELIPGMAFDTATQRYRISNRARERLEAGAPAQRLAPRHFPKPRHLRQDDLFVMVPVNGRYVLEIRAAPLTIECPRCRKADTLYL